MSSREQERKKINKIAITVLIIFLLLCLIGGLGYYIFHLYNGYLADRTTDDMLQYIQPEAQMIPQTGETEELPENPIDFKSLKERNDEVYAWIYVPNTDVNHPVVQSKVDDNYYLNKSIDKTYLFAGMIYSQSCNNLDFYDPVTVLYGHNMNNGTMFASLHNFQDKNFFDENELFYVYTEKYIFTYKIISAYKADNRHIMNSYDFNDFDQRREFHQMILDPDSLVKNTRPDTELNDFSKILVLSTCIGDKRSRYLVCGVMIDDQKTQ